MPFSAYELGTANRARLAEPAAGQTASLGRRRVGGMQEATSTEQAHPVLPTRTASQSAGVAAIDLKRLAVLCGCTIDDLHVQTPLQADGVLAPPSTEVAFEVPSNVSAVQAGIDTALISLAMRPGVFDTEARPKALLLLAGEPVLVHVLRQLWLGGIRRVLIVLGAHGAATRRVLHGHPLASKLKVRVALTLTLTLT